MRHGLTIAIALVLATTASAHDLGNAPPPKPATAYPANIPNPDRQGGDTIADAVVISSLPFSDAGTTAGYTNDYDEVCPYADSVAPDVVYSYTPLVTETVIIDLCGSSYDTKLYVYDADMNLVACNDDEYTSEPCGVYVSAIENLALQGGETYFVVIDGYGQAFGAYLLDVAALVPCVLECPAGSVAEGEPPLVDDYEDVYNGGCNSPPDFPFQDLWGDPDGNLVFCGTSGCYPYHGSSWRDTDWFRVHMGAGDLVEVWADAERPSYLWAVPRDCGTPAVNWGFAMGECHEGSEIVVYNSPYIEWVVILPQTFSGPAGEDREYDYVLWFSGLEPGPIATESTTWGSLKALYQ